jgi:hypothetical protein
MCSLSERPFKKKLSVSPFPFNYLICVVFCCSDVGKGQLMILGTVDDTSTFHCRLPGTKA